MLLLAVVTGGGGGGRGGGVHSLFDGVPSLSSSSVKFNHWNTGLTLLLLLPPEAHPSLAMCLRRALLFGNTLGLSLAVSAFGFRLFCSLLS